MSTLATVLVVFLIAAVSHSFVFNGAARTMTRSSLKMADVELVFPNKKKVKVASGSSLADAAKKAKYSPNYGCEEGKCGSCELKIGGKKIRPCIGKVPASGGTLTEP
jgi:ferredoxin